MDTVTRRRFLAASGVVAAGALVAGATSRSWLELVHAAATNPRPPGARVLVLVTLYGGNDSLSMLVPYADPAYRSARPDLAYSAGEVLPLDGEFGLNAKMPGLAALWRRKQLAIVRGVGYPKPDHSHFRSMDIWQTASPTAPASTGWLGRWLDATGRDPLRAVSLGPVLPPLMAGANTAGAALPLGRLALPGGPLGQGLAQLARAQLGEPVLQAEAATATDDLLTVVRRLGPAVDGAGHGSPSPGPANAPRAATGGNALADQLAVVAACVKAGAPTRAYSVSLGGFDTHADEKGTQADLLGQLDAALAGFLTDVAGSPAGRDVVVAVYSEFGRRVAANASQGTDHGTAGVVLVAGTPVKGGYYGEQPSLTQLVQGNLQVSTDFRAIYAELLTKVLGTDPGKVLQGAPAELGFLA